MNSNEIVPILRTTTVRTLMSAQRNRITVWTTKNVSIQLALLVVLANQARDWTGYKNFCNYSQYTYEGTREKTTDVMTSMSARLERTSVRAINSVRIQLVATLVLANQGNS